MTYTNKTTGDEVARDCQEHIVNKTILVTGATPGGLGATFATTIAQFGPALIILASYSVDKAGQTAKAIADVAPTVKTKVIELDLASIRQVRQAVKAILALDSVIDVIVNNAGVMAAPYGTTKDGIELQFGTNHVGHFLMTNLLLEAQLAKAPSRPVRVVNVSSDGFRYGPVRFEDTSFDDGATYNRWASYGQSKSANMLYSRSLAQKLGSRGVVSVSLHPGVIFTTNLSRHVATEDFAELGDLNHKMGYKSLWGVPLAAKSAAEGVATHVFGAFHPILDNVEHNGAFLSDSKVLDNKLIQSWARDLIEAEKLWGLSEGLVSQKFPF
ncbi:hypothetical protein SBRCBS47491_006606 [Sporothrix bragantina]|uniref:Short-chain dehydrogenase n=1 Tax=Sporothrix bragantina TaxID=671064 RepID=A0ABP0C6P1_9PEZI